MNPIALIEKYYPEDTPLRRLLLLHSRQVSAKALAVAAVHPELSLDRNLLEAGAMLHDIGIFLTHAPSIHCHGEHPYICHGRLGAELMRKEGFPAIARICERHTGTGLTASQIRERKLPLPEIDLVPETLEEQVICYADKFYSKSRPQGEKPLESVLRSLAKHGEAGVAQFLSWHTRFGTSEKEEEKS